MQPFDYNTAFSRNIGWLTQAEQDRTRNARVAIAGMGGAGGIQWVFFLLDSPVKTRSAGSSRRMTYKSCSVHCVTIVAEKKNARLSFVR